MPAIDEAIEYLESLPSDEGFTYKKLLTSLVYRALPYREDIDAFKAHEKPNQKSKATSTTTKKLSLYDT